MSKPIQESFDEIVAHIKQQGGLYKSWYVGVASDPKKRLFLDHQVPEKKAWWIHCECLNNTSARQIEKALIHLGCDGGLGGEEDSMKYVYAYLKTSSTRP